MKPATLISCGCARRWLGVISFVSSALLLPMIAAEIPKAPVPKSPYIAPVYHYADVMLERGRDTHGPIPSGLFLSALDRTTLSPLTHRPPAPAGVREGDRVGPKGGPLTGANPQHDQNLLRVLYTVSELTGRPAYRDAANSALKWFLENAASSATHLLPWGEHMSWDAANDQPIAANDNHPGTHEFFRPWLLWDRCFEAAPEASARFALGLWNHQIADHETGAFDRHAGYAKHEARDGMDFPRHAGFYIRTWAVAYAHTKDPRFLHAIEVVLGRFENKRDSKTGLIPAHTGNTNAWPASTLSLAIDCDGAAHRVPEPLASRLRAFAAREDERFLELPHDLRGSGGFVIELEVANAKPNPSRTRSWAARYGGATTAQVGMMCVSRYENTGKAGYRELIHAAADRYLEAMPEDAEDAWPVTFGQAISLQLAAWRSTARPAYFNRARELGDFALANFFGENLLPRASLKSEHYETITGADTLVLALLELHLEVLHITAVRCPPNTLDR
jgi:hypothetical protein